MFKKPGKTRGPSFKGPSRMALFLVSNGLGVAATLTLVLWRQGALTDVTQSAFFIVAWTVIAVLSVATVLGVRNVLRSTNIQCALHIAGVLTYIVLIAVLVTDALLPLPFLQMVNILSGGEYSVVYAACLAALVVGGAWDSMVAKLRARPTRRKATVLPADTTVLPPDTGVRDHVPYARTYTPPPAPPPPVNLSDTRPVSVPDSRPVSPARPASSSDTLSKLDELFAPEP